MLGFWQDKNDILGRFFPKSTADIFLDGTSVKIQFKIIQADQHKVGQFSQGLGVGEDWVSGISLDLDAATISKLSQLLPLNLALNFEGNKLSFYSQGGSVLSSALAQKEYQLATGSAMLNLKGADINNFNLKIMDPEPLLKYATLSGQINLSQKLNDLFPILSKIAKIEVRIDGKNVNGEILLK